MAADRVAGLVQAVAVGQGRLEAECRDGVDQLPLAGHEAAGVGASVVLAAEADELGRLRGAPEVVDGVYLRRGVDDDRDARLARDGGRLLQRKRVLRILRVLHVGDGGGVLSDAGLNLGGGVADLDKLGAGEREARVGCVALGALDEYLVLHARGVRQAPQLLDVVACHHDGGAERHRRRAAGRGIGGLGAEQARDVVARLGGQVAHLDEAVARLLHRVLDHVRRRGAAQYGGVAHRVDHRADAQFLVDLPVGEVTQFRDSWMRSMAPSSTRTACLRLRPPVGRCQDWGFPWVRRAAYWPRSSGRPIQSENCGHSPRMASRPIS